MLIPATMCVEAVYHDVQEREIPDSLSLRVLLSGLLSTVLTWHAVTISDALLGVLIGFVLVFPVSWQGGIGGGDLKLISALGAWLGPIGVVSLLFWTAIAGAMSAVWAHWKGEREFPYAPAIAAGFVVVVCWPRGLLDVSTWLQS